MSIRKPPRKPTARSAASFLSSRRPNTRSATTSPRRSELDEEHFSAVVESYDVGLLCTVAKEVFDKTRVNTNATEIKELINNFRALNDNRNRVAHGLWVPFKDGGTIHHVPRGNLKSRMAANQAAALEKLADEACSLRADLERAFLSFEI